VGNVIVDDVVAQYDAKNGVLTIVVGLPTFESYEDKNRANNS
jgi:hypothetical protein